jgi:hypothetical protein
MPVSDHSQAPSKKVSSADQRDAVVARILEAHKTLVGIAHTLRSMNDFDHAQDMSSAALYCRAAYNDLRPRDETQL